MTHDRPILAWRAWMFSPSDNDGKLKATGQNYFWLPKETQKAECLASYRDDFSLYAENVCKDTIETKPVSGCTCGIHAVKELKEMPWIGLQSICNNSYIFVQGIVELWGKVIPHTKGYRAEYAKLLAFGPSNQSYTERQEHWKETLKGHYSNMKDAPNYAWQDYLDLHESLPEVYGVPRIESKEYIKAEFGLS